MRKVLKKLGFNDADEAESGKEALELYKNDKYDLIFMDCQMPEMDGFEASVRIREVEDFTNQTKIIAVTADAMKGARERCLDSGMNDYISKPIDVEKLKTVLENWVPGIGKNAESSSKETNEKTLANTHVTIDWDRLRMFTDGDKDEERDLITMFISYAEESINTLLEHTGPDGKDTWKKAAHKLKGSAANLGAYALSEICFEAEQAHEANDTHKETIIECLLSAYAEVRGALESGNAEHI